MTLKDLIAGLLVLLNAFSQLIAPHSETPPLKSFLVSESCHYACFLGIEPGVTTKSQVDQILAEAELAYTDYERRDVPPEGPQIYQILIDDTTSPVDYPFRVVHITFNNYYLKQDIVAHVRMLIDETPPQDIVDLFGYPFDIQTDAYRDEFRILYPAQGVVFISSKTSENHDTVGFVHMMTPEDLSSVYDHGDSLGNLPTCEYVVLCAIPTATPSLLPIATPTPS